MRSAFFNHLPWRRLGSMAVDPFRFQAERGGLCLERGRLSLVVAGLGHAGMRIRDIRFTPIADTGDQALSLALAHIRRQYPGYVPPVILGLDSTLLCYGLLTPPDPLPTDMPAWVVSRTPVLLPPGLPLADVVLDFRMVRGAERQHVQVVWARRDRLAAMIDQAEQAGFSLAGVYPKALAAAECVLNGTEETPLMLCDPESVTFVPLMDGLPLHLHETAWTDDDIETNWIRLADRLQTLPGTSEVTMATVESVDDSQALWIALEQRGVAVTVVEGTASATALAYAGLHGDRPVFRLTSGRNPDPVQQDRDRRQALRTGWGGGALIGLLLLLLPFFRMHYTREQMLTPQEPTGTADIRALMETQQTLTDNVVSLRAMQTAGVAGLLESLGRAFPEKLWLRFLRLERREHIGRYQAHITGFAFTEAALRAFLTNIEKGAVWHPGETFTTTRMDPAAAEKQTGLQASLIRFELTLNLRSPELP